MLRISFVFTILALYLQNSIKLMLRILQTYVVFVLFYCSAGISCYYPIISRQRSGLCSAMGCMVTNASTMRFIIDWMV